MTADEILNVVDGEGIRKVTYKIVMFRLEFYWMVKSKVIQF
jgi:hypothetical protein